MIPKEKTDEVLRQRAEERLRSAGALEGPQEHARLLHELQVHQVELEMQNEELRRAQGELSEARDRYFELYDLAPVGYLTLDLQARISQANLAAAALLGVERRRLQGMHLSAFLVQEDADRLHLHLQALYEGDPTRQSLEIRLRTRPGAACRVRLDSVLAERGAARECRTVLIDVTAQRAVEAALQEREAQLQVILDTVPDGILTIDARGNVESSNPAAAHIFGYQADELRGRGVEVLVPGPDRARHRQDLASALRAGPEPLCVASREVLGLRKDGAIFPMEIGVNEIRDRGPRRFVCVVRDISERRRREQELRHAQRMEAIGALASGMAHDFNNLLMAIRGTADLALKALPPDHPAHPRVRQIADAVVGGASLTQRLVGFGGGSRVRSEPIELDAVIAGVGELLRRLLGEHVRLAVRAGAPGAWILADPGEIEQVLLNLATNARDAMPGGGDLIIETAPRTFGQPAALGVTVSISDTGAGMDEATRARIFEPFFSTKRGSGGTGLGLAAVLDIVNRLGGRIIVDSQIGRGTTFTLWFPETARRPAAAAAPVRAERGSETVLVVEDDPLVRAAVEHYLGVLGYRTLVAASPEEAMRICQRRQAPAQEQKIDLLLTDVMMPGRLGGDLAQELQASYPGLRVLFMSAQPGEDLVRLGRLPPEAPLLSKPFDERALGLALRRVLDGKAKAPRRVLLVEDSEDIRDSLCALLEGEGYQVLMARDGYEGLAVALREHPDAVLSDLGLPRLGGLDLARRLRRALPETRLVAMTGRAEAAERDAAKEAGFDAYLIKPADVGQILRALG